MSGAQGQPSSPENQYEERTNPPCGGNTGWMFRAHHPPGLCPRFMQLSTRQRFVARPVEALSERENNDWLLAITEPGELRKDFN